MQTDDININSAAIIFLGVFQYEPNHAKQKLAQKTYIAASFQRENKAYFHQKYYPNWVHSFFANKNTLEDYGIPFYLSNHLKLQTEHDSLKIKQRMIVPMDGGEEKQYDFTIASIEVFLFRDNLGVFVIRTNLDPTHHNWKDIPGFSGNFRITTINPQFDQNRYTIDLVENCIISYFHSDRESWRQYNPQLKTALFIDIDRQPSLEEMNSLLFDLGTFNNPFSTPNLYAPDVDYFNSLVEQNTISVFQNWKTLCLYDSLTRIAVNLNEDDKYRLWENEYLLIYIYVLFQRFYLYHTNTQLANMNLSISDTKKIRDEFGGFMNEFEYSKISYKHLPNIIFEKLKQTLEIKEEIAVIENKISRINLLVQERNEKRISRILIFLTLLTLISVAHDGGQMFSELANIEQGKGILYLASSLTVIIVSLIVMVVIFFKLKDK